MKERLTQLLCVKCIVTLMLSLVFSILALCDKVSSRDFITIFTVIISFYFGTQHERKQ